MKLIRSIFFVTPVLCQYTIAIAQSQPEARPALPAVSNRRVIIAHRGDHVSLPENTLLAYQSAIDLGVDYVEVDLRTTKDSGLVILHNESVDRMTHSSGNVRDLSFEQIRKLSISYGTKTCQIPSFAEVLALCKGKVNIYLDFKEADPGVVYKMIRDAGMERHVIVYANTLDQFRQWRRIAPSMPMMTSMPDDVKDAASLAAFLDKYPVSALDGSADQYTPDMLKLVRERKVAVWLDVQTHKEDAAGWQAALDCHVQGMQTDHPAALLQWLKDNHLR